MAAKVPPELIVFLVDVGMHMNEMHDEDATFFDRSIYCVNRILERKIFAESKDEVALILLGTEKTDNSLAEDGQYAHITEVCRLKTVDWELLNYIQKLKVNSKSADFIDGLVVALNLLVENSRGKKYSSMKIVLFSNLSAGCSADQLNKIIKGIKSTKVDLHVVGINLDESDDDDDDNSNNRPRNNHNLRSGTGKESATINLMHRILKETDGVSYSFDEAVPVLLFFQKKVTRSAPWKVCLDIGPELQIPVASYLKTSAFKPSTWKTMYARDENLALQTETSYHMNDEAQTEVSKDDTIPAYRYGKTLVPFSKEDQDNMKFKSPGKGLSVLGCTDVANFHRHHIMGDSIRIIIADPNDEPASLALSAFIHALHETSTVAIVRYCYSASSSPKIGFLMPHIKTNYECLSFGLLPFMEDLRRFPFPPLTTKTRFMSSEQDLKAIDEFITAMNLIPDADSKNEFVKPKHILNPYVQRLFQNLSCRVMNPDETLPEIETHVLEYLQPPKEIIAASESALKNVARRYQLRPSVKRKLKPVAADAFQNNNPSNEPPAKKATVDASSRNIMDLTKEEVTTVGTTKPIEDFEFLLKNSEKMPADICAELQNAIMKMLTESSGLNIYGKALICLRRLRVEATKCAIKQYNEFMKSLKVKMKQRKQFWDMLVKEQVGLITTNESGLSNIAPSEGTKFFEDEVMPTEPVVIDDDDVDDLLADL